MERKNNTNLNLGEDLRGDNLNRGIFASPWSNNQHKTSGVNSARFNEHYYVIQSTLVLSPHGAPNILAMQNQSHDKHECEQDVERERG